jgi:hypothetical protein
MTAALDLGLTLNNALLYGDPLYGLDGAVRRRGKTLAHSCWC